MRPATEGGRKLLTIFMHSDIVTPCHHTWQKIT